MITNLQRIVGRVRVLFVFELSLVIFLNLPKAPTAQTLTPGPQERAGKPLPKTALGTQVETDKAVRILRTVDNPEPASVILQRTEAAHNNQKIAQTNMVAEGTVTVYAKSGDLTFGVTVVQNGEHNSQRILLTQPDGKVWDGKGDHLAPGGQQVLELLETQHARGLQQLLGSPKRGAEVIDNGIRDASRVVTVLEKGGDWTRYSLDPSTSRLARLEFVHGQSRDEAGRVSSLVHSYSFSDFRFADGVATSFRIEHDVNGVKLEELQFTKVHYSAIASMPAKDATVRR